MQDEKDTKKRSIRWDMGVFATTSLANVGLEPSLLPGSFHDIITSLPSRTWP